jgi:Pvc16 N-terminal domain/Carboxypeptidase regulatory-like domain
MLDLLNNLLRTILLEGVTSLQDQVATVNEDQVRFQPPDEQWRSYVNNLQRNALNVYLLDLRENRKLRSNGRVRTVEEGMAYEEPAPIHLDCHYLISAQSPAMISEQVEPTLDEHILLYQAAAALIKLAPLNPGRVYPAGSAALDAWPERYRSHDLPTLLAPVEGFDKLAEFWSSMGAGSPWKPVFYLVVTLPVLFERLQAGALVTTRITEYRVTGQSQTAEILIQIGGQVLDATASPDVPLVGAWVRLETSAGDPLQTTTTNDLGQFSFTGLHSGAYRLNWRAVGFPEPAPRQIEVPSQSGEYDLRFI